MEYNLRVRAHHKNTVHARMGIWEAMEKLNELIDDSDPDVCPPLPITGSPGPAHTPCN